MTAMTIRIIVFILIAGAIFLGVRKIWRDWRNQFRAVDQERHKRDLQERQRPDVITLKRGEDGKFRPPGEDR
jgi:large-conductance mechanosensitive channel